MTILAEISPPDAVADVLLECGSATDVGRVRELNEDNFGIDAARGVLALADGMGGCNGGEVASAIAINAVMRTVQEARDAGDGVDDSVAIWRQLSAAIGRANEQIFDQSQQAIDLDGMGTTLVVAWFRSGRLIVANIGDSRLYRMRDGLLVQMTIDHTVLREQLDFGLITPDQARVSNQRGLLTRALGIDRAVEVDLTEHAVEPGDVYLLCSDGLIDMLEDDEIHRVLRAFDGDLQNAALQLVKMANDRGGYDNTTVIVSRVLRA